MSQAACVSKHWSNMLADESLWKDACQADWGLTSAFDPSLDSLPSFRYECFWCQELRPERELHETFSVA